MRLGAWAVVGLLALLAPTSSVISEAGGLLGPHTHIKHPRARRPHFRRLGEAEGDGVPVYG